MRLKPKQAATAPGDTREALLKAASEEFARAGFEHATVREICRRAGANVSAVNYHFGGKEGLYAEALMPTPPGSAGWTPPLEASAPAEARLEAFIRGFFERLAGSDRDASHAVLMAREMIEPTAALDEVVARHIGPQSAWLAGVVREIQGPGVSAEETSFACLSVVGQILFYKHCEAVLARLHPELMPRDGDVSRHVRHVTEFTLAALKGSRAGVSRPRPRDRRARAASAHL